MFPNENNLEAEFTFDDKLSAEVEEMPFRMLILGDWSGDGEKSEIAQRRLIEIDRDNFDEIINQYNINLKLHFSDDESESLSLDFKKLDDFHPDFLFNQVSLFKNLRSLRKRLLNPQEYNDAVKEIRAYSEPQQSPDFVSAPGERVKQPDDSTDLLDKILSRETSSEYNNNAVTVDSKGFNRFLRDVIQPHLVNVDLDKQAEFVKVIDESISSLMRKILHHKSFQNLESAWRGLDFLVRNTDTGSDLKIYLFNINKAELSEHLKIYENLFDSPFYKIIFQNDLNISWSILSADFCFDFDVKDIASLIRLTKMSAVNQVPFISYLPVAKTDSANENGYSDWTINQSEDARKLWTTIRSQAESEYLGLLTTRFLARVPFGVGTEPTEYFDFEEFGSNAAANEYLWANPCFIALYLIAKTFHRYGWNIQRNLFKEIDNLPAHIYQVNNETALKLPLENIFNLQETEKLLELGLMPLVAFKDTNIVRLVQLKAIARDVDWLSGQWN